MINLFKNINFLLLGRLILGYVFIYASIDKIIDPASFSDIIDNYHITPVLLNNLFALFVPMLELVIGICLIFNLNIKGASFISIALLLWFLFILSQALARGINVDCGCFDLNSGTLDDTELRNNMIKRIFEDIVLIGISLYVNIKSKKN
tara:strand:+ start:411 stop:857 length:447 start_codon:yes stop_codon:yes gene_type:complete